jgi:hypothetical protein
MLVAVQQQHYASFNSVTAIGVCWQLMSYFEILSILPQTVLSKMIEKKMELKTIFESGYDHEDLESTWATRFNLIRVSLLIAWLIDFTSLKFLWGLAV